MEILKFVLMGLAILVCLLLIIPIFTKRKLRVEREIIINKPCLQVFGFVKILKNQDHFSVWAQKDPEMLKEYRGIDGTVGFVSGWDSKMKDVGKGEQEIKKIADGKRIDYELRFIKPFAATNYADIVFTALSETQTKVSWGFAGEMKYPMNLFLLLRDMDSLLGKDLQEGLANLKELLEK